MQANTELGKIPIQIVEIDQDRCGLVYGVGACTATGEGNAKCFNTIQTCQVPEAYTLGAPLTMRFIKSHSDMPGEEYLIPSLSSVSTNATVVNIGGRSGSTKPLGKRASVTIGLKDHPHSDNFVDPYINDRSYNPLTRGTLWSKWLRRNPYYTGRSLRIKEGYYGQSLAEMKTRHYVIDSISLPDSNGNVQIKAQDILRLADDDKAQAPKLSNGKLLVDITKTDATITVTGGDISEYNQGGTAAIRINDEVIRYSSITVLSSGDLQFNTCVRASDNTEADEHEADDSAQACLQYTNARPDAIAYDLLTNYGNIDTAYINLTDWQDEATTWFGSVSGTRLITEPVGVTELLGQLTEQFLFYIWWDDVTQLIRFKALSPVFGDVPLFTENSHLLQNSTSLKTESNLRVSEVWISYLQKSPVEDIKKRDSYKRVNARIDPDSASPIKHNERRVYEVNSPWINNDVQVTILSARLLARYKENPVKLSFSLDAKDRDVVDIASVFDVQFRAFVDDTGFEVAQRYQVTSIKESVAGERIDVQAIKFAYDSDFRPGKWMARDAPIYYSATEIQKESGSWWAAADGTINGDIKNAYQWS